MRPDAIFPVPLLHFRQNGLLDLLNSYFVALVEGPLLDSLGAGQSSLAQYPHVLARCRLTYVKFACNQAAANSILHQITVDLWREMLCRVFEPLQNLQSALVRESANSDSRYHGHV